MLPHVYIVVELRIITKSRQMVCSSKDRLLDPAFPAQPMRRAELLATPHGVTVGTVPPLRSPESGGVPLSSISHVSCS